MMRLKFLSLIFFASISIFSLNPSWEKELTGFYAILSGMESHIPREYKYFSDFENIKYLIREQKILEIRKKSIKNGGNESIRDIKENLIIYVLRNYPFKDNESNSKYLIIKLLIDNGEDPESKDYFLESPLYHALYYGEIDIVKLLVKRGAKNDCKGILNNIKNMINYGSNVSYNIVFNIIKALRFIMCNFEYDINMQDDTGNTLLHVICASTFGNYHEHKKDLINFLLLNGADVRVKNNKGLTPIGLKLSMPVKSFKILLNEALVALAKTRKLFENCTGDIHLIICDWFIFYDNQEESSKLFRVSKTFYNMLNILLMRPEYVVKLPVRQKYALFERMGGSTRNLPRLK